MRNLKKGGEISISDMFREYAEQREEAQKEEVRKEADKKISEAIELAEKYSK